MKGLRDMLKIRKRRGGRRTGKYLLIINPQAGNAGRIEKWLSGLVEERGMVLDVMETRKRMDAKRFAEKAVGKYSVVIAAGGDGTVNEVVNGLAGSDTKLGIIPLGTENVLANGLGIPLDSDKAFDVILDGKSRRFDLGKANGRYFILMAGVGLDAKSVKDVGPALKRFLGSGAYHLAGIKNVLTHVPCKLEIWLDEQVLPRKGYFAVIGNSRYYGGGLEITQFAEHDDGYLDVCIFKRTDVFNMLKSFLSAASKGSIPIDELPNIEYFRVKKVRIVSEKPVLAHTDAEVIGTTPLNVGVCPKAISLICGKQTKMKGKRMKLKRGRR